MIHKLKGKNMDYATSSIENQKKKNGFVIFFKILKMGLKLLFPSYVLLQINRNLAKSHRFYENDYFPKQIKRNLVVTLLLSLLFLGPIGLGLMAVKGNKEFQGRLSTARKVFTYKEVSKSSQYISLALKESKFVFELKFFGSFALFGLLLGNFIILNHSMIKDSKKLIKFLKNEGIINKENSNPTVLFTQIGVLIDISGSAPKEIASNERIWLGMNIQIKDWAEDPDKRSLVFFKTAFKLKPKYNYFLSDLK
jgi:hypothetical protein